MLEEQRRAVERLKAALFGADPYARSHYIQDYHREFRSYRARIGREVLLAACARSDIVFVGDYHALPSCQAFAAGLLEYLAARGPRVLLFLEMVFGRDQRALDRFLADEIGPGQFRRAIRYDRDWGYPWEGYGRLLETAKRAGVAVIGADAPPRGGLRLIRRRDRHAALRVVQRLIDEPGAKAVVLFGESHVARGHLPLEVARHLARENERRSSIVVVQNVEDIYWEITRRGDGPVEAVRIGSGRYAVFNASPLAKYEAYRQTLLHWSQQEDEAPDYLPSVHHLVELLAAYLGADPYRTLVAAPRGGAIPLVDLYPGVVARRERRAGAPADGRGPVRRRPRPGVVYRERENRIDVYTFSIAATAEAAAHFLLAAFGGRAGRKRSLERAAPGEARERRPGKPRRGAAEAATRLLEEAFVAFAVSYLDPAVDGAPDADEDPRGMGAASSPPSASAPKLGGVLVAKTRAPARALGAAAPAPGTGTILGRAVYAGLRRRGRGKMAREWLLSLACLRSGGEDENRDRKIEALLRQGAALAGWGRRGKR